MASCYTEENQQLFEEVTATSEQQPDHTKLDGMTLMAGFIKHIQLIKFVDERIPKNSHFNVTHGEALAALLLLAFVDAFNSIRASCQQFKSYAIKHLLDISEDRNVQPEHFSRDVMGDALDALYEYGLEKFNQEFIEHLSQFLPTGLGDEGHIDTSAISTYHQQTQSTDPNKEDNESLLVMQNCSVKNGEITPPKAEDEVEHKTGLNSETYTKTPADITYGKTKDHRPDLPQIVIASIVDGILGIPYTFSCESGNANDKIVFAKIAQEMLSQIKKNNNKFRFLIGDSAACTKEFFKSVLDSFCHAITRCPDNFELAKKHLNQPDFSKFQPIYQEEEIANDKLLKKHINVQGYKTTDTLFGYPVSVYVIYNPNLEEQKRATLSRAATKEKRSIESQLLKKFKCKEDADAHLNSIKSNSKLCSIVQKQEQTQDGNHELVYDYKWHRSKRGRPKAEDISSSKENLTVEALSTTEGIIVDHIRTVCDVHINEEEIEKKIKSECIYVLVCTDVESDLSIREVFERYKRNTLVESLWRLIKNKRVSISNLYLKKVSRIESLLFLMSIGLTGSIIMQYRIREIIKDNQIEIPTPDGSDIEKNITIQSFIRYAESLNLSVIHSTNNVPQSIKGRTFEYFIIHKLLGKDWYHFILDSTYEGIEKWGIQENPNPHSSM